MSEFFLELFSEEIPAKLQVNARTNIFNNFKKFFEDYEVDIKGNINVYSTPNRLVVYIDKITKNIKKKTQEIKGPSVEAPDKALEGFIRSNKIKKSQVYKKNTERGDFYFYKNPSIELIKENIPNILNKISWDKSMKWGSHNLYWGRPLKSILTVFDGKKIDYEFYHLKSSNKTYIDKDFEEKNKIFNTFKSYNSYFKSLGIIIDQDKRKLFIKNELIKLANKKNLKINFNEKLLEEITNIVEKPKILLCEFDKKFLGVPEEIIITTMQNHQKYFPTFDKKEKITNNFFVVTDCVDIGGAVKLGNERVVEARLTDAEFFWKRNKSNNLVKQVSKLKDINYFQGLGSYYDKVQRMRKLSGLISDELLISKEKMEIASSVCKVDLMSDLVGEFPELQGVMG